MKASKSKKIPLSKRSPYSKAYDDEKVARNWNKASKLYGRGEYSVAVLRCGTCVELAVNFAVRQELVFERKLPIQFVDRLLRDANGLQRKYQNIFLPIMEEYQEHDALRNLWKNHIQKINRERNIIIHSGEFRSRSVAREVVQKTYHVLHEIMDLYEHEARIIAVET